MNSNANHSKDGRSILASFSPLRRELHWITLSSVAINLLALATPLVMLQVFDRILARGSIDTLTLIITGASIAILLESLLRVLRSHLSAWIGARFEHKAMLAIASRLLAMPLHEFERQGTGVHQDHFKAAQSLKQFYSGQTFQQLIDLPFTALYIAVVTLIDWRIGALLAGGYLAFGVVIAYLVRRHGEIVRERTTADSRRNNFLVETLANIHTLKSMTMEALMQRRYERLQEASARAMERLAYALDLSSGVGMLFSPVMTTLVVALGALFVIDGELTTGELAACTLLGLRSLAPIQRLGTIYSRHKQEQVMRDDLAKLVVNSELAAPEDIQPFESDATPSIDLKNVSYAFPGAKASLFDGLSLAVKPGECIVIHGENGVGKTTLLQIIGGIVQPTQGEVLVDGRSVKSIDPDALRAAVAYLPQRTTLFEGTLVDNISMYSSDRIDGSLDKAATLQIGDFVAKLPRGWDSQVGDAAAEAMPPGFRQRIAIVRALATDPKVILFDDATAAIDSQGEAFVLDYLKSIKGKYTVVLVTQRPSFQRLADRTFTLTDGKLIPGAPAAPVRAAPAAATPAVATEARTEPVTAAARHAEAWERTRNTIYSSFKSPSDLAACLPVLLKALGWRRAPRDVVENLPYFTESLDLTGLENAMAQVGYRATEARATLDSLDSRTVPCLFVPREGAAFVVLERRGDQLTVADDVEQKPREIAADSTSGRAFFFSRLKEPAGGPSGNFVPRTLGRFRPLIIQAGLSSLLSGVVLVTASLFLMTVYNFVIPSGSHETLNFLTVGTLLALGLGGIFVIHRAKILSYIAGRVEYLFGSTTLQHILGLSPSLTERSAVAAQIARLGTFEAIRDLFVGPVASTILESPATLVVIVALGIINPVALLVFVIVLVVYGLLFWLLSPISTRRVNEVSRTYTKRNEFVVEMITKMRTIRECGGTHVWHSRFRQVSAEASMASFEAEKLAQSLVGVSYFIMMFAGLMIVGVTVPLTLDQTLGPGALIASMLLMWRVLGPFQVLFTNLTRVERVRLAVGQLENLMKIRGERLQTAASPVARGLKGRVEFQRVSFRYSLNVDPALIGVDFRVESGSLIAITGANGSGKSTLIKLLLGMYQPQAGSILVDGADIRQLDPIELRRLIGYAPQETHFFRATLAQNLRLVTPDATDAELREALELAGALEQVDALPKGLDYRVGDNASEQLPASLRQKLGLARAYLTRAPIMLFDEPGAGLDDLGDAKFMQALQGLRGKATVFFISHRPSHIRLADLVMVFDRGYLRAMGKPSEILRAPGAAPATVQPGVAPT